jgi:threonine/homoserine/homoserine lactone efflux protein
MDAALPVFGWLIFAVGVGVVAIAEFASTAKVRSPTKRAADALSGLFFVLLACQLILPRDMGRSLRIYLLIAAVAAGIASWWLGRHSRQVDRATGARHR